MRRRSAAAHRPWRRSGRRAGTGRAVAIRRAWRRGVAETAHSTAAAGADARDLKPLSRARERGWGEGVSGCRATQAERSEEHTSELQSLMRISYAVFCLKKKKKTYKYEADKQITVR